MFEALNVVIPVSRDIENAATVMEAEAKTAAQRACDERNARIASPVTYCGEATLADYPVNDGYAIHKWTVIADCP